MRGRVFHERHHSHNVARTGVVHDNVVPKRHVELTKRIRVVIDETTPTEVGEPNLGTAEPRAADFAGPDAVHRVAREVRQIRVVGRVVGLLAIQAGLQGRVVDAALVLPVVDGDDIRIVRRLVQPSAHAQSGRHADISLEVIVGDTVPSTSPTPRATAARRASNTIVELDPVRIVKSLAIEVT